MIRSDIRDFIQDFRANNGLFSRLRHSCRIGDLEKPCKIINTQVYFQYNFSPASTGIKEIRKLIYIRNDKV